MRRHSLTKPERVNEAKEKDGEVKEKTKPSCLDICEGHAPDTVITPLGAQPQNQTTTLPRKSEGWGWKERDCLGHKSGYI